MRKRSFLIEIAMGMFLLGLIGCQRDDTNISGTSGRLVINVTDAPFPIEHIESATVLITKVEIRKAGEDEGYPFLVLSEEEVEMNLLELRNGLMAKLVEIEVPAGDYDLVRLYVDQAGLKVKDGEAYEMKVPSGAETGIKVFISPFLQVKGGLTTELLLDFNLEKSFVLKGNPTTPAGIKGFNFKPVIRAVNISTSGRMEGRVADTALVDLANAQVWIEKDSVVASAFTDSLGYYAIIGIPSGLYSVFATKENYDTVAYHDIEIVAANRTIQNFILTPDSTVTK